MKKLFFVAMLAIAALGSCSKYDELEQIRNAGAQTLIFTATMEEDEGTRAIYNSEEKRTEWEVGDKISINGKTYLAQEAGTTTTFKAEGQAAEGPVYKAYFPADLYDGTKATLPATQTYTAGKFNMPMYAQSTSTELHFKNLCAVLAIKVTSADIVTLKSIKVASDKNMNGTFTVDENNTAVIGDVNATNFVELISTTALTLDTEGTTFYISIPAQEYKYLNIFLSSDGKTYTQAMATKKVNGIGTIGRSKIFNIDYKKNATKLWAGKFFIADCNVGATSEDVNGGLYTWGGTQNARVSYTDDHNTGSLPLSGEADTATELWGDNWRMPTKEELEKLNNLGQWDATNKGLQCNSTDYSGNSVFLPAAGYCGSNGKYYSGTGEYWSSTPTPMNDKDESNSAYRLHLFTSDIYTYVSYDPNNRIYGNSVRAVLEEAKILPVSKGKAMSDIGEQNWVQLWEGGPKFAEYNVGVTDVKKEIYGDLYRWHEPMIVVGGGVPFIFVTQDLTGDALRLDTAYNIWGSNWRMPTKAEFEALLAKCDSKWTGNYNNSGVAGRIFTGKGDYSDNSIFLPASGFHYSGDTLKDRDLGGVYWSSTFHDVDAPNYLSWDLEFNEQRQLVGKNDDRNFYSIRAVLAD